MTDAMPDYALEIKRLEIQRKDIEITVLDQKAQLADFVGEREGLATQITEYRAAIAPQPDGSLSEGDRLRALKSIASMERSVMVAEARLIEIDGLQDRYNVNIAASDKALRELNKQIGQLKEAHGG